MPRSLSNLLNKLAEGIHKIKCKYANNKKCETCGIKYKDCERYDVILYKCFCCNRNYPNSLLET